GVKFLLSNSNVPLITELYKDYEINVVDAKRSINSDADKRGSVEEVLIRNYN
ncbi:DNA adenine methylase, partial [Salmonella enterica subsp. enterica serovar Typhimurium]